MERTSVYIDALVDEVCPSTLETWAKVIAGQADGYGVALDEPVEPLEADGAILAATVVTYRYLRAERQRDGTWTIPDVPDGFRLHAFAFGPGDGWFADMMIEYGDAFWDRMVHGGEDPCPEERAAELRAVALRRLAEESTDPEEWLVVEDGGKPAKVLFHLSPPRCELLGQGS
jgi:hypothetical protein